MASAWEIVCPDHKVRHYPYTNFGDAHFDAQLAAKKCQFYAEPNELETKHGRCPGGAHGLRPAALPTVGNA